MKPNKLKFNPRKADSTASNKEYLKPSPIKFHKMLLRVLLPRNILVHDTEKLSFLRQDYTRRKCLNDSFRDLEQFFDKRLY